MLSLAMIVKNEVQTIERTIKAVENYVDEIIIGLDTESSDGTDGIVKDLADVIISTNLSKELEKKGPINDGDDWGFSAARNKVFNECNPENWRLILDGHETVLNPERLLPAVKEAISKGCDGIEVTVNFEPDENGIPQTIMKSARLMAPTVKYNNPNHNVPVIKATHFRHDIFVDHRKKDQALESKLERDKQRSSANIEGLRNKVRVEGNNARAWFYLATAYKENARYHEAIKAYEECLLYSKWNEERWHARYNAGICLIYIGENEKAREQFILALEEFPPMAEAYYQLANLAYKQKYYREAEVWLDKCVTLEIPNCRLFTTPKIYLSDRYDLLSMVYNHLGQYEKAVEQAEKAFKATSNPRIEKNIKIWKNAVNK